MTPWTNYSIDPGKCKRFQIGPLKIWIQRDENEWLLAIDHEPDERELLELGIEEEKPNELSWIQVIAGTEDPIIHFQPLMPDRSVVVRPRNATQISVGRECVLYVFIPAWVRINAGEKGDVVLLEIPSLILSNTWFGNTMEGESCYALKVPAELDLFQDEVGPNRVICPVKIKNHSDSELVFQRLCVNAKNLNIYQGKSCIWSNEIRVNYEGTEQECEIKISNRVPQYDGGINELITKSREPVPKNLFQRTFSEIKSFPFSGSTKT